MQKLKNCHSERKRRISVNFYSFVSVSIIAALFYQSTSLAVFNSPILGTISTTLSSLLATVTNLGAEKPKPEKVELKDERTENSKTYLNPNGTYTTEISQQPINYEDNGQLKPIDTSLAKDTDGYKVDKNSLQVDFDNKVTGLLQITNSEDNTSINYKVADSDKAQITPIKKSDNELSYDNYKDGASLNYKVQAGKVKEEIVLDKPPADNTFTFELDLGGLKPKEQKDGSIFLLDPKKNNKEINPKERNKPSFIIEAPFMSDSAPQDQNNPSSNISGDVKMEIKQQKNDSIYESSIYTLKVVADKKWLEDPKRVYPVKIDPTFSVQQSTTLDTYISSDVISPMPARSSEEKIWAGSRNNNPPNPEYKGLLKFDTSLIPKDADISSARLYLSATVGDSDVGVLPQTTQTYVYRATTAWDKNATWPQMASSYDQNMVAGEWNTDLSFDFDVTGIVRNFQQGLADYGFVLNVSPAGFLLPFYSYEANTGEQYKPRLRVTYNLNRLGRESYRTYKDFSGVSVDVQTGNAIVEGVDVNISSRGPSTYVSHIYNSQDTSAARLRQGFLLRSDILKAYFNTTSTAVVTTETGSRHIYTLNADQTTFTRPPGVDDDLVALNGGLTLKRKDGSKIVFEGSGRLSKEIDKSGNELIYDYNTPSVTNIKDALNRSTKLFYNPDGNIGKIVDFAGRTTSFTYDWYLNGRVSTAEIINPAGKKLMYYYDNAGRLIGVKNPNNETTTIAYNDSVNAANNPAIWETVKSITDPLGKTMSFDYTTEDVEASKNLLVNSSFEDGTTRWNYFGSLSYAVNPSASIDPVLGNYYLHTYTANPNDSWFQDYSLTSDNPLKVGEKYTFSIYVRSPGGTPISGNIVLWELWGSSNQYASTSFTTSSKEWQRFSTTLTIANVNRTTLRPQIHLLTANTGFQFDGAQLEKNAFASSFSDNYTAPKPREVSFSTATDPKGAKTTYYFNSEGLVSKVGEPIGSTTSTAANAPYFPGHTITMPAPAGGTVEEELDDFAEDEYEDFEEDIEADMADADQDPVDIVQQSYNAEQIPKPEVSQPLAEGTVTQYQYDANFNVKTIIEKDNTFTTFNYDANGNKIEEKEHDHDYPEVGSASTDTTKHRTTTYTYDANNNLISQTTPTGKTTSYTYDAKGNLLTESSPLAGEGQGEGVTSYTYDPYGNQLTKTDPEGNKTPLIANDYTTTNTYDAYNNLTKTTDATGVSTYYTYDELGNKIAEKKETQDIGGYIYDSLGRVIAQKSATNDKGFYINNFSYDNASNKTKDETYVVNIETDQTSPWFNNSWQKRINVQIDNRNNSQALSNYQVKLIIPHIIGMKSDFSDLRFSDTDKITELPYWVQNKSDSAQATVWIKVPSIAALSSKTIYMYYSNPNATSASNGAAVFEAFDVAGIKSSLNFNERSGIQASDETGIYNGTLEGANWSPGKFGNGVNTEGNAYVSVPSIDIGTSWSIESWIQAPIPAPTGGWATLTRGTNDHQIIAYEGRDLGTFDNTGGTNFHDSGFDLTTLPAGWHHLVAVGTTSGTTEFYIDGVLRGSSNFRSTSDIVSIDNYQGGGQPFGTIDEVKVYDRALSASEVETRYNNFTQKMGSYFNIRKYTSTEPTVNIGALKKYTSYSYNQVDQLTSQANYMSNGTRFSQTDFVYDANGNKIEEKRLQNDTNNNPIYSTTTYEYDQLNRLLKETRPDKSWTAYKYDSFGNVVQEGTPEGTTANIYDKAKNQVATATSDGTVTKSIYDKEGNERITGDAKDVATATNYDANGNIVKVADPASQQTNYGYDANQNETTVTAPDNTLTTTNYNQANQVTIETDQNTQPTNTTYNNIGQEQTISQPNSQNQSMDYTTNGGLTDTNASGTTTNSADTTTTYDALNNPKTITTDMAGSSTQQLTKVETAYDDADRVSSTTDLLGTLISYNYDYLNNLVGVTDSSGTTTYAYDTAGKLKSISDPNNQTTNLTYEQATLPDGTTYDKSNLANTALPNGVQTDFSYDEGSKITQLANNKNSSTLSKYNYTYDANGNITKTTALEPSYPRNILADDFTIFNPLLWTNQGSKAYHDLLNNNIVLPQSESANTIGAWYNNAWLKRAPITIKNTTNPYNLTNYQVKVNISYDTGMKADFSDLRFTTEDKTTEIPYWIESYSANSKAVVWLKVPTLKASSTKTIYMYYKNTNATNTSNGNSVFEAFDISAPKAYYKLDSALSLVANDETGVYNGTLFGDANLSNGKYNSGVSTSSNGYLSVPSVDIGNSWSIASWFLAPVVQPTGDYSTLARGTNDHQIIAYEGRDLGTYDNAGSTGFHDSGFDLTSLSPGWHHMVAVGTAAGTTDYYIDGTLKGSSNFRSTTDIVAIGNYQGGYQPFGTIDEVKLYDRALTAAEIQTISNNMQKMGNYYNIKKQTSVEPTASVGNPTSINAWYNGTFSKRTALKINNTTNPEFLTDYQVKVTIPYQAGMKADFSDIRFTDSDKLTEVPYWIEGYTANTTATVWLKVPSISPLSNKYIYMYYSNPSAVSASNGSSVFELFDVAAVKSSYKFNENSGTQASDETGIYNGTLTNSPSWISGKFNSGISTSGNAYVSVPSIDLTSQWSIESWIQAPIPTPTGGWATLTRGTNDHQIIAYEGRDLGTFDNTGGTNFHDSGFDLTTLPAGWHHLVAVGTAAGATDYYIDGVLRGSSNFRSTTDIVSIGNYQGGGQPFGSIDETRIYDRALSSQEISGLYNGNLQKTGSLFSVRKQSLVEPIASIDTTTTMSNINGLYSTQSFNRSQYPIIKADFKTDNTNSGASVSTEGSIDDNYNDSSYRSLGVVFDGGNIKVKTTTAGTVTYPITAIASALTDTYYTVEFEFSPTDTKVYVYRQGDPKPALPAYTYTEAGWDPNLIFTNYQGNTYIDNVDIKTVQDATNYVYNNLNRLTQVKDAENEVKTTYTYDDQGNRLTKTGSSGTTNYAYSAANELLSSTVIGQPSTTYTYDANGNTLTKVQSTVNGQQSTSYTYDNKNQLVKVVKPNGDTIEYVYDGNGNRYSKTVNGQTRYYSYDTSGNIVSEYKRVMVNGVEESQTLVRYVRDTSGKAISMIQYSTTPELPNSTTYYFVYNGHGDVTALTDSAGTVVATYSYDEFGNQISSTGNIYNPLRYSGAHNAYYDSETALYKMGTRYYQPDVGRWLTRDSYAGEQENPQTQNRYVYVSNNPINSVDPTGHWEWMLHGSVAKQTAEQLGFSSPMSSYIKQGSIDLDFDTWNPLLANNFRYHFNTWDRKVEAYRSKAPWRYQKYITGDSRAYWAKETLNTAIDIKNRAVGEPQWFESGHKLGLGLHMIQDIYAHLNATPKQHMGGDHNDHYDNPYAIYKGKKWKWWRLGRMKKATFNYINDFRLGKKR